MTAVYSTPSLGARPLPRYGVLAPLSASTPSRSASTRFGNLGPEVGINLIQDTAGVLAPKLLMSSAIRGKKQSAEDVALEALEDVPFYLVVPVIGDYAFGNLFKRIAGLPASVDKNLIGTSYRQLLKHPETLSKELVGAKAGALVATAGLAIGAEYLVYFAKNLVNAFAFKTRNFEAVAGFEPSKNQVDEAYDPVLKTRKRLNQVGKALAGLGLASLTLPALVKNVPAAEQIARGILKQFDFGNGEKTFFQLSKPVFASIVASGYLAGLDSARSPLERVENGFRIAAVIGYLLFGKELAANGLAKFFQNHSVTHQGQSIPIKSLISMLDPSRFQKDSALDINIVKDGDAFKAELEKLAHVSPETKQAILKKFQQIQKLKLPMSAVFNSVVLMSLTYLLTAALYKRQKRAGKTDNNTAQASRPDDPSLEVSRHRSVFSGFTA